MNNSILAILKEFNNSQRLASTLACLDHLIMQRQLYVLGDDIKEIHHNYHLMLDFLSRGYKDDSRNELYNGIINRTYRLIQNIQIEVKKSDNPSYYDATRRLSSCCLVFDSESIYKTLERYVTDMAMLTLETENIRKEHKHRLLVEHDLYMTRLFDYILLSYQWSDTDAMFYKSLLISPSIDIIDAQWIIGAIIVACVNVFDLKKLEVLAEIYVAHVAEPLRQRALVGWAMALDGNQTLMLDGQKRTIDMIIKHDKGVDTLRELQIQLLTSVNALYDEECIKRDIMPSLLKQGKINLGQLSQDIFHPSNLKDILHPEESENMMNEAEAAMNKMKEMANKGRDVYYGGFRQAKRYGFFSKIAHWFEPFFWDNPAIEIECEKSLKTQDGMKKMVSSLPFCDNDKYSFIILFSKMMEQIPEQFRKAMTENKAGLVAMSDGYVMSSSVIRRNYLHDLFRFYQLYGGKNDFIDGFMMRSKKDVINVFVADKRLFGEVEGYEELCCDALRFLEKLDVRKEEHYKTTIMEFLNVIPMQHRLSDSLFVARYMWQHGERDKASKMYEEMMIEFPNNIHILRGVARSRLGKKDYKGALKCFNHLVALNKNDVTCQVNRALCLVMLRNIEEAMPILHELYYNNPDNMDIVRLRLWAMMSQGKSTQIVDEYKKLCEICPENIEDHLNYGYCLWLSGQIPAAIKEFSSYISLSNRMGRGVECSIFHLFEADWEMLIGLGLSKADIHLMADAVDSHVGSFVN